MDSSSTQKIAESAEKETSRLEAFSDGVIAIAITLLALEIKVPEVAEGVLLQKLVEQWPMYLAFLLSFSMIGIMWINHHRLFTLIKRVDHIFLILNALLLMGITLVPFTSALLGAYILHPLNERVAVIVYNGLFMFISVAFNSLWWYAVRQNWLVLDAESAAVARVTNFQYRFGPLYYLAAMIVALFSAPLSITLNIVLAIFFALPVNVVRHLMRE